jgi:transcriptional regulator with XRE-family HTH domain
MTAAHAPAKIVADPDAIRGFRYEKGWNVSQLAASAGIDQGHMSRIERGHIPGSPRALRAIADALGTTVAAITKRVPDTG